MYQTWAFSEVLSMKGKTKKKNPSKYVVSVERQLAYRTKSSAGKLHSHGLKLRPCTFTNKVVLKQPCLK